MAVKRQVPDHEPDLLGIPSGQRPHAFRALPRKGAFEIKEFEDRYASVRRTSAGTGFARRFDFARFNLEEEIAHLRLGAQAFQQAPECISSAIVLQSSLDIQS
jgi:hypothetical protein